MSIARARSVDAIKQIGRARDAQSSLRGLVLESWAALYGRFGTPTEK